MIYVGIDPGRKGGVAWLDEQSVMHAEPLRYGGAYPMFPAILGAKLVAVEKQHGRPTDSVKSLNDMLPAFGYLCGWLNASRIPYVVVAPTEWGRAIHGRGRYAAVANDRKARKALAVQYVRERWPSVDLTPGSCRVAHDGVAEAVCICAWLAQQEQP